ncbi:MAG: serine/threonine-protein kinase, partial [Bacteroidota bacterium]
MRWQHVCALFEAALDCPPDRRAAFLQATTGADAGLLAEVQALLDADAVAEAPTGGFLDIPAGQVAPMVEAVAAEQAAAVPSAEASSSDDAPPDASTDSASTDSGAQVAPSTTVEESLQGTRLGPWRLVREIGRGGMGTVWLAERADGAFEQRVAIKRVRASVFSEALRRRFLRERSLLARLHHPYIAQLIDGGVTDDGVPYLVMEYVPGTSLLEHCAARNLGVHARIELFLRVCEAVQYAHRHLVIHRDLKPSNILVTPDGRVKLLDFGIGKLQHDDDGGDALTLTGIRPFTPQYAAPEQIRNQTVTTATDVYGLGVLLFELLTGQRPFTAPTGSVHEIERAVLEDVPPSPSTALRRAEPETTGFAQPQRVARLLSGDLDAIVRKALAKTPERRYRSAEAFARDLKRHLEAKPVQARRGAFGYRLRRDLYRHRATVASLATIITLLVAGIVAVATQAHRASVERDKALASAQFLSSLFGTGDADLVGNVATPDGSELSARTLLNRAVARIDRELADQPETRAAMELTVGRVYRSLGLHHEADALLRDALATRQRLFGVAHPRVAEVELALGALLADWSRYDEAERLHRRALSYYESTRDEDDPRIAEALYELGRTLTLR